MGYIELRAPAITRSEEVVRTGHRPRSAELSRAVLLWPGLSLGGWCAASNIRGHRGGKPACGAAIKLRSALCPPPTTAWRCSHGRRHEKLDEAHMLKSLQAVQLAPSNVNYRLDTANILMEQERYDDSLQVLRAAAAIARSPLEVDVVERVIKQVQQQEAQIEEARAPDRRRHRYRRPVGHAGAGLESGEQRPRQWNGVEAEASH